MCKVQSAGQMADDERIAFGRKCMDAPEKKI